MVMQVTRFFLSETPMSVQERHNLYAKMTDGAFDEEESK